MTDAELDALMERLRHCREFPETHYLATDCLAAITQLRKERNGLRGDVHDAQVLQRAAEQAHTIAANERDALAKEIARLRAEKSDLSEMRQELEDARISDGMSASNRILELEAERDALAKEREHAVEDAEEENAILAALLRQSVDDVMDQWVKGIRGNLDSRYCCDGRECGCGAATVREVYRSVLASTRDTEGRT